MELSFPICQRKNAVIWVDQLQRMRSWRPSIPYPMEKLQAPMDSVPNIIKKMAKLVVGPLTNMFGESGMRGCLPPTLNLAHISLILKKDKPADNCASYRPISLLGTDIKILAKLLARRLELVLPTLINPDQTGFIKNRYSHSNVRRLLNIIHFSQYSRTRALILSLDAEKAFDRVEWEYLFDTLDKFGLGPDFINWIYLLYRSPTARIRVNGSTSDIIPLSRGTRQGCPLSPLLFALALEPLAETIRHHKNLSGVTLGKTEHKISLYADDVLLFITNPEDSIPNLISIINQFGEIPGYKINFEKSEALPLGNFGDHTTLVDFPFKWSLSGFIYLGIRVSTSIKDLYKQNFTTTVKSVKNDLNRWFDLPLSCMGRISLIKMNALPRLLYPMQMLPLRINRLAILDIQRSISRFIWYGKRPRLKMRTLQLPLNKGGQALPNFLYYNWARHARVVYGWLKHFLNPEEPHVDAWSCAPHSLLSLLSINLNELPGEVANNLILKNTLKIWRNITKQASQQGSSLALKPLIHNKAFPPGWGVSSFNDWHSKGLKFVGDLFDGGNIASFSQIQIKYGIPRYQFFGFLQARHFAESLCSLPLNQPIKNPIESFLLDLTSSAINKKFISLFYRKVILCDNFEDSRSKGLWENDLGIDLDDGRWYKAFESVNKLSLCNRLRENQYRILHRLQCTPYLLHKINPQVPKICIKCKKRTGTYYHCFWLCPLISKFWRNVAKELTSILLKTIKLDPALFLLNISSKKLPVTAAELILLKKLLLLARRCVLLQWIREKPPTVTQWYKEMFQIFPMEHLSASLRGNDDDFYRIWQPLLNYLPDDLIGLLQKGCSSFVFSRNW
uniref:Reverse transcriptase domain-containing protein n=1 Tax=Oryzias latipes TaxID=8090 RepID=A0A3B3HSL8_ORYLA